ncbi:MAG: FHA domain-containing protein [Xenococcaceae cyanobacterium]
MSAKVILTVTQGKLKGQKFVFDSRTTSVIGRASDCYPRIPDDEYHSTISRYHCFLDINPPDIRIKDLGSLQGTYVSGKLIGKRRIKQKSKLTNNCQFLEYDLQDNDEIQLSNTVFRVNIQPEITETEELDDRQTHQNNLTPPKLNLNGFIRDLIERANQGDQSLRSIQNYTILDRLGAGGFSEVYLARHQQTQELVAIKIMIPKVAANQQKIKLFLREVKNTQILQHPHVIQLKDYCFSEGIFFLYLGVLSRGYRSRLNEVKRGKISCR